ncbi:MAG: OsmC family protein [Thermoanaerobaculia bacterium]
MTKETEELERKRKVDLEHIEGFRFRIEFGGEMDAITADEPPPLGEGSGPDAARLVAAAIGNCLSASLLLCLQKSRIVVSALRTHVELAIERNEAGRLRIARGDVRITLDADGDATRIERCMGLFEDYCTVTATLRGAFPVEVEVVDEEGKELHRSLGETVEA